MSLKLHDWVGYQEHCGYRLVNQGANTRTIQDYLGHRDVRHTELYTEVDTSRFRGLWRRTGSDR